MILCPDCGAENIEGADVCDQCQLSLTDLSLPQPATDVEKGLLRDRIESLKPRTPLTVRPDAPIGEVLEDDGRRRRRLRRWSSRATACWASSPSATP